MRMIIYRNCLDYYPLLQRKKNKSLCKNFPKISGFLWKQEYGNQGYWSVVIKGMLTNLANTQRAFWFEVGEETGLKKGRNKSGVFMFM